MRFPVPLWLALARRWLFHSLGERIVPCELGCSVCLDQWPARDPPPQALGRGRHREVSCRPRVVVLAAFVPTTEHPVTLWSGQPGPAQRAPTLIWLNGANPLWLRPGSWDAPGVDV